MIWFRKSKHIGNIKYGISFFKTLRSASNIGLKNKGFYGVFILIPVSLHKSTRYYNIDEDSMVFGKQVGNVLIKFEITRFLIGFSFNILTVFDKSPFGKYKISGGINE